MIRMWSLFWCTRGNQLHKRRSLLRSWKDSVDRQWWFYLCLVHSWVIKECRSRFKMLEKCWFNFVLNMTNYLSRLEPNMSTLNSSVPSSSRWNGFAQSWGIPNSCNLYIVDKTKNTNTKTIYIYIYIYIYYIIYIILYIYI